MMHARKQLDFSFRDLVAAAVHSLRPGLRREALTADLERAWSTEDDALVALSVRTAFDAYLSHLNLPHGSEVVMTGINIPDMVQIVEAHGLSVVPADLNMRTLEVEPSALRRAITPLTRVVVAAHLFGARMNMEPVFKAVKIFIYRDGQEYGPYNPDAACGMIGLESAFGIVNKALKDADIQIEKMTESEIRKNRKSYTNRSQLYIYIYYGLP